MLEKSLETFTQKGSDERGAGVLYASVVSAQSVGYPYASSHFSGKYLGDADDLLYPISEGSCLYLFWRLCAFH